MLSQRAHRCIGISSLSFTRLVGFAVPAMLALAVMLGQPHPALAAKMGHSCYEVLHVYPPTTVEDPINELHEVWTTGVDGKSYVVQYRIYHGDDPGDWMTPAETPLENRIGRSHAFQYSTGDHDMTAVGIVEWRIRSGGHHGDDDALGMAMIDIEGEQNDFTEMVEGDCMQGSGWNWAIDIYEPLELWTARRNPHADAAIRRAVPAPVINAALANPSNIPGWLLPADESRRVGDDNPRRTCLTLSDTGAPWSAERNGLVFVARCE